MDLLGLELHIPAEAEVKNIPVWSLPNSVLRRMGLPTPAPEGSSAPTDHSEAIWICPTLIRKKDQAPASLTGNGVKENMSLMLYREFRSAQGPLQVPIVSSNCTAYKLLQDILPGKVSTHTSHAPLLPQGSPLKTKEDVIIICRGRIYLIVKNPKRSRSKRKRREPQQAAQSSLFSTSAVSSDSQEKELLNDNKSNKNAGRKQTARFQTQVGQEEAASDECETQDLYRQEAEGTDQNNSMDNNMQREYHNGSQSCTSRVPSPHQSCDFIELQRKEKIAQLKAKLRRSEADLHNKHSSK